MPLKTPTAHDCVWMAVTCAPEVTTVEFCEDRAEAVEAATLNLMPTISTFVGAVELQGEHRVRGSSKHIAVHVEVTPAVRAALRARFPGARSRAALQTALSDLMEEAIARLGDALPPDEEVTDVMRGRERANPDRLPEDRHGAPA